MSLPQHVLESLQISFFDPSIKLNKNFCKIRFTYFLLGFWRNLCKVTLKFIFRFNFRSSYVNFIFPEVSSARNHAKKFPCSFADRGLFLPEGFMSIRRASVPRRRAFGLDLHRRALGLDLCSPMGGSLPGLGVRMPLSLAASL